MDVKYKISSSKYFWIQRLSNENLHKWILIPLRYTHKVFGKNVQFHSNLHIPSDLICSSQPETGHLKLHQETIEAREIEHKLKEEEQTENQKQKKMVLKLKK